MRYAFFFLAAFITFTQVGNAGVTDLIFISCGVVAYLINRYEANIYSLLLILVLLRATEICAWYCLDARNAYIVYPFHILIDSIALYAISQRNRVLAKWEFRTTGEITPHKYVYTNADYILSFIYKCYLLAAALALTEHIIRHVDDFGLPIEWAIPDLVYVHSAYPPVKLVLNTFEYVAILATAHRIMQSERYVHA